MEQQQAFVVTGGNAGIGFAIAEALLRMQNQVVIVCRDAAKGRQAVASLKQSTGQNSVELVIGDLGSVDGVRRLAAELLERCPNLHCLINNAGVWPNQLRLNEDGLEEAFMVNHLAPFMLNCLLLPQLQANAPARIVNVNAGLYVKGVCDLEKTPWGKDFSAFRTYANTKMCSVLTTVELARRLLGSGVTINAVHPGVIRSNLGNSTGLKGLLLSFIKRFWGTPEEGAKAPVWLATADEVADENGQYYFLNKKIELIEAARDEKLADRLWRLSVQLTGGINYP